MGLRRLVTEFLWPYCGSIIRPWLPYNIKVLVKTIATKMNDFVKKRSIKIKVLIYNKKQIRDKRGSSDDSSADNARGIVKPSILNYVARGKPSSLTEPKQQKTEQFLPQLEPG
ncbi:hypothetical protein EVAR_89760_1 [Eumeta japonica]|uniref:Uncharacterized protein n=1 Tax=Eumeta variegata TaxID=151549 RepID=A0A4C1XF57_EUMVA|nr:hypothetical protein EVAR_89760_1 [Eumeta japonica]